MNMGNLILWGFVATLILTSVMAGSKHLGMTRMDLPFMLGTMFTADRNKASSFGFLAHVMMGWIFSLIYGAAFESSGLANWWFGMAIGFVHAAVVLSVGLEVLNFLHPRMARPFQGPTPTRQLQPPGFFALHYGRGTPLITFTAHLLYGAVLGLFYR